MTKMIIEIIILALAVLGSTGSMFAYVNANYADKEDISLMFDSLHKDLKIIEKDVNLIKKIQCASIHKTQQQLWEVNCQ